MVNYSYCDFCEESSEYVVLVPKPNYFITEGRVMQNTSVKRTKDLICLECLNFELNELKHIY